MMFINPNNLDEVCVQATHIVSKGKKPDDKFSNNTFNTNGIKFKGKGKCKKTTTMKKGGD